MFSFKNHPENETGELVRDLFVIFETALYKLQTQSIQHLSFNIFW